MVEKSTILVQPETKELIDKAKIVLEGKLGRPITDSEAIEYYISGRVELIGKMTRQVSFRYKLEPLEGVKLVEGSPLTGIVTEVLMHWPEGCEDVATGEGLVDIAFGHSDKWILPHAPNTFLSLSKATPLFRVSEPVIKGEELWVVLRNADNANIHAVAITVTVEGVE